MGEKSVPRPLLLLAPSAAPRRAASAAALGPAGTGAAATAVAQGGLLQRLLGGWHPAFSLLPRLVFFNAIHLI